LTGRSHISNNRLALVCSARSAASKAEGTTNRYVSSFGMWGNGLRLIRAAEEALFPGSTAHVAIVKAIREDHILTAKELIHSDEILTRVTGEIEFECKRLEDFLNAAQVHITWAVADNRLLTK